MDYYVEVLHILSYIIFIYFFYLIMCDERLLK